LTPCSIMSPNKLSAQLKTIKVEERSASEDLSDHLKQIETSHRILAIGASTGGTTAIEKVLTGLPKNTSGTVICQHMPKSRMRGLWLLSITILAGLRSRWTI